MDAFYGGIEAGGTKFICAVGTSPGDLRAETQLASDQKHMRGRGWAPPLMWVFNLDY